MSVEKLLMTFCAMGQIILLVFRDSELVYLRGITKSKRAA